MGVGDPAAAVHEVATRKLLQGGGGGRQGGRQASAKQAGGWPGRSVQLGPGFEYGPPGFWTRQEGAAWPGF